MGTYRYVGPYQMVEIGGVQLLPGQTTELDDALVAEINRRGNHSFEAVAAPAAEPVAEPVASPTDVPAEAESSTPEVTT